MPRSLASSTTSRNRQLRDSRPSGPLDCASLRIRDSGYKTRVADVGDIYELEQLAVQPGTYVNPQTEVVIVVDDSATVDQDVFEEEGLEGNEWVRVSDEVPVDETLLEEALDEFHTRRHPTAASQGSSLALDDDLDDDNPELEPDPDEEEEG